MPFALVAGATCVCTMGIGAGQIMPTSKMNIRAGGKPVACILDVTPMSNITPCGMCTSMTNPAVASATAAALGVLTPQPCVPVPAGGWAGMGQTRVGGVPVLTNASTLQCSYGGTITITNPGQMTVQMK